MQSDVQKDEESIQLITDEDLDPTVHHNPCLLRNSQQIRAIYGQKKSSKKVRICATNQQYRPCCTRVLGELGTGAVDVRLPPLCLTNELLKVGI